MSQARRPKSEFMGLHDPYADGPTIPMDTPRRPVPPLMDKEKGAELLRAGASLAVIVVLLMVVVVALY